jgi:hypothetical protein
MVYEPRFKFLLQRRKAWEDYLVHDDNILGTASAHHSRCGSDFANLGNIEFEKTARGQPHGIGVLKEWKWEGMISNTLSILLLTVC